MPYPVTFKADYVEKRSRLTTFFRCCWRSRTSSPVLLRARRGRGGHHRVVRTALHGALSAGDVRLRRGLAALLDARLRLPAGCSPTSTRRSRASPATPIRSTSTSRRPRAEYSRLKVLFRLILAIPVLIIQYAMQIVAQVGAFLAWFAIVSLGRQPKGLQDMIALGHELPAARLRVLALVTEDWPPFTDETAGRRSRRRRRSARWRPRRRPRARAADLGAARRLRLARARGGLPAALHPAAEPEPRDRARAGRSSRSRRTEAPDRPAGRPAPAPRPVPSPSPRRSPAPPPPTAPEPPAQRPAPVPPEPEPEPAVAGLTGPTRRSEPGPAPRGATGPTPA